MSSIEDVTRLATRQKPVRLCHLHLGLLIWPTIRKSLGTTPLCVSLRMNLHAIGLLNQNGAALKYVEKLTSSSAGIILSMLSKIKIHGLLQDATSIQYLSRGLILATG